MNDGIFIGAAISIGIFLLTHLGVAIWFASKVKTELVHIREDVTEAAEAIKQMATMNTRISVLEQRMNRVESDIREALIATALVKKGIVE